MLRLKSNRLWFVLGLLTFAATTSALAQIHPRGFDLPVTEAPASGGCEALPASAIVAQSFDSEGTHLTVTNFSSETSADYLIVRVVTGSTARLVWSQVTLEGSESTTVDIETLESLDYTSIQMCGVAPDGIVDSPDPVVSIRRQPPDGI